jgi:hypothetical protein
MFFLDSRYSRILGHLTVLFHGFWMVFAYFARLGIDAMKNGVWRLESGSLSLDPGHDWRFHSLSMAVRWSERAATGTRAFVFIPWHVASFETLGIGFTMFQFRDHSVPPPGTVGLGKSLGLGNKMKQSHWCFWSFPEAGSKVRSCQV